MTGDMYKEIPQTTFYGYFQKGKFFLGEPCTRYLYICYTPHEKDTLADSPSNFFLSNFDSFMFLTY